MASEDSQRSAWRAKGGFGGGTLGYNWQYGTFVVGVEGDGAFGDVSSQCDRRSTSPLRQRLITWPTVRGRFGVAFDQVLLYGTGGVAWADTKYSLRARFGVDPQRQSHPDRLGRGCGRGMDVHAAHGRSRPNTSIAASMDLTIFALIRRHADWHAVNSGEVGINYHF